MKTRGIVLSGDGSELVVRATPDDVLKFASGAAVEIDRRDDVDPALAEWLRQTSRSTTVVSTSTVPGSSFGRQEFVVPTAQWNAILRTACGCERRMRLPKPMKPVLDISFTTALSSRLQQPMQQPMDKPPTFHVRRFELVGTEPHGVVDVFVYREVVPT